MLRTAVPALAMALAGLSSAQAATIGPDAFGYRATDDFPFIFQNIAATGTRVLAATDDASVSAPLGFNFSFYGASYSSVSISSNGLLTFGGANSDFSNVNLSTFVPTGNLPSIAPFWDDLYFVSAGADAVYYQTFGAPGNFNFIVQWNQADHFAGSPSSATFQVILLEAGGAFLFSYSNVNFGDANSSGASATVGIRDVDGQLNGRNLQWSFNQAVLSGEQTIAFTQTQPAPVPEPMSMLLVGTGLAGLAARARRRRS